MKSFYIVVFAVLVGFIIYSYIQSKIKKINVVTKNDQKKCSLFARRPLSEPEQTLYWTLLKAFPDRLVLPQVSFSRFLYAKGDTRKANFSKFARVRQKVADYVLCDKAFNVLGIIELDDSTHDPKKDRQRDEYLKEAGINVYRFNVRQIPGTKELQKILTAL